MKNKNQSRTPYLILESGFFEVFLLEHHSRVLERGVREACDDNCPAIAVGEVQTLRDLL